MRHWMTKTNIILALILLFSAAPARGSDCIDPDDAYAGKPISLRSGSETLKRTDLSLGNLHPITVKRRYNSRSQYDSALGYGWAHNYDKRLYTYPDGSITLRKECGWKRRFTFSGGGYLTPPGETGSLVQNPDGTFTFFEKTGEKEIYDERGRLSRLVDANGNALVLTYADVVRTSLWGVLPWNVDQTNPLIVAYDYRLARIEEQDPSGSLTGVSVTFFYDPGTGRLISISDSLLRTVSYGHDTLGNLTTVTGPSGGGTYKYEDMNNPRLMTGIDEGTGEYVNTYDDQGRVLRQTHGTGEIDIEYLVPYQQTRVTTTIKDSTGTVLNTNVRIVEFDGNGQVSKETDTFGNVTTYLRKPGTALITQEEHSENTGTVDTPNLVLKYTNTFTYDDLGNMLTRTEAFGSPQEKTTTWTYDPTWNKVDTETVTSVVDPTKTRVVDNDYDPANGKLKTVTETGFLGDGTPYTYTTTYDYHANGKIKSIDGPRTDVTDVTTYAYDPTTGYLTGITQPLIGTTTYGNHDALGNPRTVTDPNGNATAYTYDETGRVKTVKAPGDTNPTQYVYLTLGCAPCGASTTRIDYIQLPEGNRIDYDYDLYGNLVTISDSAGNSITYTYDSEGNRLTEEIKDSAGALQKSLTYQYDALNRLKRINNPDASYTEYAYDSRGNRTALRNPNSALTNYEYDSLNRLVKVIQPGTVTTGYAYNTNNNLTTVTDANTNTTTYKYDDKGRVYQVISPDTGTTTYAYDPAGNLTSKTDASNVTVSYTYDALNRLTKIDFTTDTDILYTYDNCINGKGRLCAMADASGTTSYEYTPKGRVATETRVIDTVTYVTQYTYDQNGNMKTMTYPSGKVITYNYTNDRAVSVLNNAAYLAQNITYKPFGGMTGITYGNNLRGTIGYDNQYRISSIAVGQGFSLAYSHDYNGNITGITNNIDTTNNKAYTYDALDRLETATATNLWGSLGWTYDGVGNRQTQTENASSSTYAYETGTNKLTGLTTGGTTYPFTYDPNGNTDSELRIPNSALRTFEYNQNQRLIAVVDSGITKGEYVYNGNGQRVKKTVNTASTIYHYSLSGQLIAESDIGGTITAEYVYLNGQPLAKIEGTNVYYYHNDHLGTPQKMTDGAGQVVWEGEFKPFGEAISVTGTVTNNLRFPGQYYDAETGLNYNYFRDYNPFIGRYVQADPIGIKRGMNHLYAYVANDPINLVDPLGLFSSSPPLGGEHPGMQWFYWNIFQWFKKDSPQLIKEEATAVIKCFVCTAECVIKEVVPSLIKDEVVKGTLKKYAQEVADEAVKKFIKGYAIPLYNVYSTVDTVYGFVECSIKNCTKI